MRETRVLMGMPVTVEICDARATKLDIEATFEYFTYIDQTFSTYKPDSEITKINSGLIKEGDYSPNMKTIFELSEKTKQETNGYFDIKNNEGKYDPSGLVKGWAIREAADILKGKGFENFFIEAGGDIQVQGRNEKQEYWKVGIRNPFNVSESVKTVFLKHNEGIATSGSYERGGHIYNPLGRARPTGEAKDSIVSLTVIGKDIYQADRFATAAFAMQKEGINFIEGLKGFEAYAIDNKGLATQTSGFKNYTNETI